MERRDCRKCNTVATSASAKVLPIGIDPDRNRIELQVDNFADMSEATTLMQRQFGINPIGEEIDPEDLLARLRSGVGPDELVRPTRNPGPPAGELIVKLIGH